MLMSTRLTGRHAMSCSSTWESHHSMFAAQLSCVFLSVQVGRKSLGPEVGVSRAGKTDACQSFTAQHGTFLLETDPVEYVGGHFF
jgi:hypothetical protein